MRLLLPLCYIRRRHSLSSSLPTSCRCLLRTPPSHGSSSTSAYIRNFIIIRMSLSLIEDQYLIQHIHPSHRFHTHTHIAHNNNNNGNNHNNNLLPSIHSISVFISSFQLFSPLSLMTFGSSSLVGSRSSVAFTAQQSIQFSFSSVEFSSVIPLQSTSILIK